MSEIFTEGPVAAPALFARWYRVEQPNMPDEEVAGMWRVATPADREFWAGLDALRDGVAALAARLEISAAATRPSRKSDIEDQLAAELRGLLEA
jgi:hypothetical protein